MHSFQWGQSDLRQFSSRRVRACGRFGNHIEKETKGEFRCMSEVREKAAVTALGHGRLAGDESRQCSSMQATAVESPHRRKLLHSLKRG